MPSSDDLPVDPETVEVAEALLRDRLNVQRTAIERIETKATVLLGFAAAAGQFVLSSDATGWWLWSSLALYGASIMSGVLAIGIYEHSYPPEPRRLVHAYLDVPKVQLLDVLARTRADAFYENAGHMRTKRRAWIATLILLILAVVCSTVALSITSPGGGR